MDCFGAQRESSTALISAQFQRHNLLLKLLWIKLQWFSRDFVGFVQFYVFLQLLAFSLCSLRHLVLLQGLGKRKIAVCIYKQTIKIKSTMYWHRRIRSVIHMFLGSARLLLYTANGISSPALTSVLITAFLIRASFFLCQEAPTLGQILQNTIVFCRRDLEKFSWILRKLVPNDLFWHSVEGWLLNTSFWPSAVVLCSVAASPLIT